MWGYAYHYWVTSQNVEIVYSNMQVMYSDLPFNEKQERLRESTVNEQKNERVNCTYVVLLSFMIVGYILINYYYFITGQHGGSGDE